MFAPLLKTATVPGVLLGRVIHPAVVDVRIMLRNPALDVSQQEGPCSRRSARRSRFSSRTCIRPKSAPAACRPRAPSVRRSAADGREQPTRSKSQRRTKPMKETRGRGRNRSPSQPRHRQACIRRVNEVTCALRFFYGVTLVQREASRGLFRPRAREASRSHERRGSRALPGSG